MKKKIVIITIVSVGIAIGCYLWSGDSNGSSTDSSLSTTVKAERGPIQLRIESTGRVVSNLDVEIKCKASGEVIGVPYDVSDPVKKGDLLVELDPIDEQRRVKQAEVNLSSSKAKLVQAQQNLETAERNLVNDMSRAQADLKAARAKFQDAHAKAERAKKLLEAKRVSIEENETAQTTASLAAADLENAKIALAELKVKKDALEVLRQDVTLAEGQVESNKIALEMAQQRLKDTKVFAPIDGVIAARQVEVGQIISSPTSNVGGGTALLVLSDLSRIFVLASVDESDIGRIEVGQRVTITADAFPDKEFYGKVVRVAARGENTSNVVTFDVKIEVLSEGKQNLKPEMTANVVVIAAESENALLVPSDAVYRRNGKTFVLVPSDGQQPERRNVEVGIDDGVRTEILSGLKEGEEVVHSKGQIQSRWARQRGNRSRPPMSPMMRIGGKR
ncbi:MAG: hypothetical protein DRH70_03300 [Candidatus Coatesbacteria bacterium]|nr:MAG: hypothetical protein DRH70_03300 [Candidatus Coatesbacteria bacterium]